MQNKHGMPVFTLAVPLFPSSYTPTKPLIRLSCLIVSIYDPCHLSYFHEKVVEADLNLQIGMHNLQIFRIPCHSACQIHIPVSGSISVLILTIYDTEHSLRLYTLNLYHLITALTLAKDNMC